MFRNRKPEPKPQLMDSFKEKHLNGKIQVTTSSPDPQTVKDILQRLIDLNFPPNSVYIRWNDEDE